MQPRKREAVKMAIGSSKWDGGSIDGCEVGRGGVKDLSQLLGENYHKLDSVQLHKIQV